LYVGTIGEGLFRSIDGGETYRRTCDGMFVECHVRALAVDPRDARVLWIGTEQGLYRSKDGADNWQRVESPLNGMQIWSILLLPHDPDIVLVGTCPSRVFRSVDGGRTWTEPGTAMLRDCPRIIHTRVTSLMADASDPENVYAGVEIDGVWHSRDAGVTWQRVGSGLSSQDIHALVAVPGNGRPKRLLAATNNDLNISGDNGATWQPQKIGQSLPWSYCRTLAQKVGQPEVVLLGNGDGPPGTVGVVGRSTDGGQTWRAAEMPGRANSTIWNFAVHAADPELIYASSVHGLVYRSENGGETWSRLAREFGEVRALAWTPEC